VQVGAVQVQPTPEAAVTVRPVGSRSVTVTMPLDGVFPTFETVTVYVTVCPGRAVLGVCVFAIVRSLPDAGATVEAVMVVGCVAVLLLGFESPPPDTNTLFVIVPGATLAPTLAVTVMTG
jgi:hypothetical protein